MHDPANASAPLVVFERVSRRFGMARAALDDVSFAIDRSEFVLLTGPSGAGKSTVIRLIAALDRATSGRVLVAGEDVARLRRRALPLLRRSMGIVLQDPMLLDDRSVLDNVSLPALAAGLPAQEALARGRAALARVGLDPATAPRLRPRELSGGEQQRVALARAIVNRPALVLADEPTAHLDRAAAIGLLGLLEQFAVAGVAVVVASHGELAAAPARSRVIALKEGRLA
jgi:cell division transport system ATP-binding protein